MEALVDWKRYGIRAEYVIKCFLATMLAGAAKLRLNMEEISLVAPKDTSESELVMDRFKIECQARRRGHLDFPDGDVNMIDPQDHLSTTALNSPVLKEEQALSHNLKKNDTNDLDKEESIARIVDQWLQDSTRRRRYFAKLGAWKPSEGGQCIISLLRILH
jgi:hypothetical protein